MAGRRTTTRSGQSELRKPKPVSQQKTPSNTSSTVQGRSGGNAAPANPSRLAASLVLPTNGLPSSGQKRAQQQARRRRQTARHVRRFESVMAKVHIAKPAMQRLSFPSLGIVRRHPSRMISLLLLVMAIGTIGWVHYDLDWYVYREYVTFHNVTYHEADALYAQIGVEGWSIFWISPSRVREQLVALPTIADAQVHVRPPHWVTITVQETEPVARWITQEGNFWLLPDGTALPQTDDRYDALPQIVDNLREASIWGDTTQGRIDPDILQSALALIGLLPEVQALYYHADVGLNFHMVDEDAWVYWGDGSAMEHKYSNLVAVRQLLQREPQRVNVVDIRAERPVLR